jgi:hypothetical protein
MTSVTFRNDDDYAARIRRLSFYPALTHSSRCGLQYAAGYAGWNVETPGKGESFRTNERQSRWQKSKIVGFQLETPRL